ncbi:hypothetical protein ES708_19959 [subsurface metagenome]
MEKKYYSERLGEEINKITLGELRDMLEVIFIQLEENGYFQHFFGSFCKEMGYSSGKRNLDFINYILLEFGKDLFSLIMHKKPKNLEENDIFTFIEFLYDNIAAPDIFWNHKCKTGEYFPFDSILQSNCQKIDVYSSKIEKGKQEFQQLINKSLRRYKDGFNLNEWGFIMPLLQDDEKEIISNIPIVNNTNIDEKIKTSLKQYLRHSSRINDKKQAVRDLADILEYIRDEAKNQLTSKDEGFLFNIANNFGIRHHNANQKTNWEKEIWLNWIFFTYLNTIKLLLKIRNRRIDEVSLNNENLAKKEI